MYKQANAMKLEIQDELQTVKSDILGVMIEKDKELETINNTVLTISTQESELLTTMASTLESISQQLTAVKQQNKCYLATTNKPFTGMPFYRKAGYKWKYCFTHGACNHHSKDCSSKREDHQDDATFDNRMGGSTKRFVKNQY